MFTLQPKHKKFINYVVGPLLFCWLMYSIRSQILHQPNLASSKQIIWEAFSLDHAAAWSAVIVLMLLNWGVESIKWQYLMKSIEHISFGRAVRAVFTGQALAFSTINRLGEFAGRAVYLADGNRIRGAVLSFAGSLSQICVTGTAGWLALLYWLIVHPEIPLVSSDLSGNWLQWIVVIFGIANLLYAIFYFHPAKMVGLLLRIPFIKKFDFFFEKLALLPVKGLTIILLLSALRFVIYSAQYIILFRLFGVAVDIFTAAALVSLMMLLLALVPSIALVELGFRGQIGLRLFSLVSANAAGILATTAGIWVINLIIPALAGSLLVLGVSIFNRRKKDTL